MLLQSNNVWTLNQAAVTASCRIKSLPSAKCVFVHAWEGEWWEREPAVQDFLQVGEGVPWKTGFYKLLTIEGRYFQLG